MPRILGIDPGTGRMGYGVLDHDATITFVDCGIISPKKIKETITRSEQLSIIHAELIRLIQHYKPHRIAVEKLFFNKNVRTAMAVSEAIGVILLTAELQSLPVHEYTPLQVKEVVVGSGRAKKQEVKGMLEILLDRKLKGHDDAADALAVAFCHISLDALGIL